MEATYVIPDEASWRILARDLVSKLRLGDRVALHGDLGVGKSTFVRACLAEWGWTDFVSSPSYPLMIEYELDDKKVIHMDAFRLKENQDFPVDPELLRQSISFVEWPEKTKLGPYQFEIYISETPEHSRIAKVICP